MPWAGADKNEPAANAGADDPPKNARVTSLQFWLGELQKVEQHRTNELQHQQARIATLFSANFIALSFLVNVSFNGTGRSRTASWFLAAALVLVAAGVVFGLWALWPGSPSTPKFLNAQWIYEHQARSDEDTLDALCCSMVNDIGTRNAVQTLTRRRLLLRFQLGSVGLGVAVLMAAVVLHLHFL